MTHLLVAAIITVAFGLYSKDTALIGVDNSAGWMLTATVVNALTVGVVFLLSFGLVTVLD